MKAKEIRGKKVILRERRSEDAAFFAYWYNQPKVMFQCGFTEPTTEEKERAAIARKVRIPFGIRSQIWMEISLERRDCLECGLYGAVRICRSFYLIQVFREKGMVQKTIRLMIDLAIHTYDMNRIAIGVVGQNTNALEFSLPSRENHDKVIQ